MSASALSIRDLRKTYPPSARRPSVEALRGITLDIAPGEIFTILGPNGAGKSTLINILVGLVKKTSGDASVFGFDVERDYRDARNTLGVVPQEITYDPFFTVREGLNIQAGLYGIPKKDRWNDTLLERLTLQPQSDANPRTLSGGMKRRLLIAKGLVHRPKLLILDEPTAGVDVELRHDLWNFVRDLNTREGMTVLLTTHNMEEAEQLSHRIAIIAHGELKTIDTLEGLKQRYGKSSLEQIYLEVTRNGKETV